jgi:hypothetical protein
VRTILILIVLALSTGAWSQSPQAPKKQTYAGAWWAKADAGERSGFLNGVADCMTWTAHQKGFNATPEQLMDRISKFYKSHPEEIDLSIVEAWQKVEDAPKAMSGADGQGETWKNPHWYLNGDWWGQLGETEQLGFVDGYLWCLRTQIQAPIETYSLRASSYRRRISAFVMAHPKLGKEPVAVTLRRYKDHDAGTAPLK